MILKRIGHLCDYILFDEAWAGFMKFHPLYAGRFAMGLANLGPDAPGIIATQSTHKQLASFSQASQIHIKDRHIKRPEAPGRAPALQRELHAARLDLAVLSAVRLARRRRADDEGPLRRGAVGRHDPARHRTAQEDPRGPPRIRGEGGASRAPLVLRAVRARPRRDPRRRPATAPCTTSPGRRSAPTSSRPTRATGSSRRTRAWHGFPAWRRASP